MKRFSCDNILSLLLLMVLFFKLKSSNAIEAISSTSVATTKDFFDMDSAEATKCPAIVKITRIQTNAECSFMNVRTMLHDDHQRFDIFVLLHREMGSNYLLMNIKLKIRPVGEQDFKPLFFWRRLDFCAFLTDVQHGALMHFFFKKTFKLAQVIACPIRKGNYTFLNLSVIGGMDAKHLQLGTYKFFVEIVQATGEIAKVFAMQLTSVAEAC